MQILLHNDVPVKSPKSNCDNGFDLTLNSAGTHSKSSSLRFWVSCILRSIIERLCVFMMAASVWLLSSVFALFVAGLKAGCQVQLNVYYESKCPDSDVFFHQQLWPTYQKLYSNLNVELVPYGNAEYQGQRNDYSFKCQHGPDECYGNLVQTCYIELVNNTSSQIQFVNCAFEAKNQKKSMEKCIADVDLRRQVKKCVTSPLGNNLEYEMAKKTDALNPPHTFVPWVTVNGKGGEALNDKANADLLSVVCEEFTDDKPDVCKKTKRSETGHNYL